MTRSTVRDTILGFWTDEPQKKTAGMIVNWLREFRFVTFKERKELFRKSIETLPETTREYLRTWRREIWGQFR